MPESALTPREIEVLELIVAGLNNKEIAERLIVSRSTIKTHVSNILSKLGTSNRAEAAALAVQNHLVT
jgi:NarL family two-component system response regulator LiaR